MIHHQRLLSLTGTVNRLSKLLFIALICFYHVELASAQQNNDSGFYPPEALITSIDLNLLNNSFVNAPPEFSGLKKTEIELPLPDGSTLKFVIEKSAMMEKGLSDKFPDIQTYRCYGKDKNDWFGRIVINQYGLDGYFISGNKAFHITPNGLPDKKSHRVYWDKDDKRNKMVECELLDQSVNSSSGSSDNAARLQNGTQLRTYRIAITNRAITPSDFTAYTAQAPYNFSSQANFITAITAFLSKVTTNYERDASIHFNLVANNNLLYQADTTHVGYPFLTSGGGFSLTNIQNYITSVIGTANFDVGQSTCGCSGAGLAALSSVCSSTSKASAYSTYNSVATMCHELGHQFSAGHSWNGTGCGVQWASNSAVEPGSGSTIMGYRFRCGTDNIAADPDESTIQNFSVKSYEQIINFSTTGGGNTCPTFTSTSNTPPTVTVPVGGFSIPKSTPFSLTGSATDPNVNTLSHSWEQVDIGTQGAIASPVGNSPIFRAFNPIAIPSRTFPQISDIVNNTQTIGELLPTYARQLNFRLFTRDNVGGGDYEQVQFNVTGNSGPFKVTNPNSSVVYSPATNILVTWDISASTAYPVSCPTVDILLSTDGGYTFPTTLITGTSNDGSQSVTLPNITAANCRVMVRSVGNIFFDMSDDNFSITSSPTNSNLALGFDGTNDVVYLTPVNKPSNFTLEMWVKTAATSGLLFGWAGSTGYSAELLLSSGNVFYNEWDGYTSTSQSTAAFSIGNSAWHHVAIIKNGTGANNLTMYVDGTLRATASFTLTTSFDKMTLGAEDWFGSLSNFFSGSMDEVRIWNVARTPAQITASMNCGISPGTSGLVSYYNFNNPGAIASGTNTGLNILADNSGNARHGTLNSFALTGAISNWIAGNATLLRLWYQDADADGYGNPAVTTCNATKPAGYVSNNLDCNDANASLYFPFTYYQDLDLDTYGSSISIQSCQSSPPVGYSSNSNDCNDANAAAHPGAVEICNGIDDDCDGLVDEGFDIDNDGYTSCNGDCNDNDATIYPGANEIVGNAIDENCNGQLNENSALNFDGTNDYLSLSTSFQRPADMTIEFWIKTTSTAQQEIVSWRNSVDGSVNQIYLESGTGKLIYAEGDASTWAGNYMSNAINTGAWVHVAITRTSLAGNNLLSYINGVASFAGSQHYVNTTDMFYVGGSPGGTSLNGTIDELRIWNIARSQSSIAATMNCGPLTNASGLQMYYGFNEGIPSGTNTTLTRVNDMTTNHYNSTLNNFAKTGATSNWITGTASQPVIPSVSITASPSNTICSGVNVTFTATPTNGGSPTYLWKKNGVSTGITTVTYANSALVNGDQITCQMTSTLSCVTTAIVTSNIITMNVSTAVVPAVSIAASPSNTICSGANVTFTATPTNGGSPTYLWKKNGVSTGVTTVTYANSALLNGDQITCQMTSSLGCVTANPVTSNTITMVVSTAVTPSVAIAANPSNIICSGVNVTFTATPTNGGSPTYLWKKNGVSTGVTTVSYSNSALLNGDQISCDMTSSLTCVTASLVTSNIITMAVTANVTPAVSIAASPSNTICSGVNVTFTATPTNGGSPTYLWKKNGVSTGITTVTYANSALLNGDQITCQMTSSLGCVSTNPVTSNTITMVVTTSVTPAVSIAASPSNTICSGTNVTFTATPTNGGSPTYLWKKNGVSTGVTTASYANSALLNGDQITCEMTSTLPCVTTATVTSNTITMAVTANVVPSVSIAASPSNTICSGTNVTFTATPTNGGSPTYLWKKNGVSTGVTAVTYANSALLNGDQITCQMTSSLGCVTTNPVTSNTITMVVTTNVTPAVSIAASPSNTFCSGVNVTFTATPTNGGTPTYLWKKNGVSTGVTTVSYASSALLNGDQITCDMTSTMTCVTTATVTSNTITMAVSANVTPSVSIAASPSNTICSGVNVTFTATPTNGGSPTYLWKKNGVSTGITTVTYANNALLNGDQITCQMTSSLGCVTINPVTSNTITMVVTSNVTASVSIAASPSNIICSGVNVTFTATPINGGTPTYSWKKNGVLTGVSTATYSSSAFLNGDQINCDMTSSLTCVTASAVTSNTITMAVTANVTPSVSIAASPSNTICSGVNVTFTATPTNGGTPTYLWKKNGVSTGITTVTYANNTLLNSDQITCQMTSSLGCVTANPVTSNTITMAVTTNVTPSVSIAASPSTSICANTNVIFTATPTNGGTPTYLWKKNGVSTGITTVTYSNSAWINNDQITCQMTSSLSCVTTTTVNSNVITETVNGVPTISSFTPASGPSGTSVVITGTNFVNVTAVKFNSVTATYIVNGPAQITATVPVGASTGNITVTTDCGTATSPTTFTFVNSVTITLKVFIEGFYRGSGNMISVSNPAVCDTIILELHNSIAPYALVQSVRTSISTLGSGTFVYPASVLGNSYYLVVKHRNALETWSGSAVLLNASTINYDFTTAANKAFGSMQRNLLDGRFAIYSGDINQNGVINLIDQQLMETSLTNFGTGYNVNDLTGDSMVDSPDYSLIENNVAAGIAVAKP